MSKKGLSLTVAFSFYLLEIKKVLSYRVEFWLGFVGNILTQFGAAYFLWKAIFMARGVISLQGYSFGALMLYYLLVPLVERCVNGQEGGFMSGEIYDGGLSRYLLYPISYFKIKYVGQLAQSTIYFFQLILGIVIFLWVFQTPFNLTPISIFKTLPVMVAAGLLHFTLFLNLEMIAFWADNVWSILVMNRMVTNLLGGGLVPLAFFPNQLQAILEYLPFMRLVAFPIHCLLGQVGLNEWLKGMGLTLLWAGIFALTASWLWRQGLRTYSGVGI